MKRALLTAAAFVLASCGKHEAAVATKETALDGEQLVVRWQNVPAQIEASGVAQSVAQATISTKLMATVTEVRVREGDRVSAGQVLAVLDSRDLVAKDAQISAGISGAEAMQREALTNAQRMRTLFAEDAAPKAQLDAAEAALARANAAVEGARAGAAEIRSVREYSLIRAPFDGVVTRRFVDPGAFAAPGAPLVTVEDSRRLRIRATTSPDAVRSLKRGDAIEADIEGIPVHAVVEGVVTAGGSLYAVNAIVDNSAHAYLAGSAASLRIRVGTREAIVIPESGVRRQGDLTGVLVYDGGHTSLRWVKLGDTKDGRVEILAGLRNGETIVVPRRVAGVR
jgi:RND family efflux transporter MFP subunit